MDTIHLVKEKSLEKVMRDRETHLVMAEVQFAPDMPCFICSPDPPNVTGRLKLAMSLVYISVR